MLPKLSFDEFPSAMYFSMNSFNSKEFLHFLTSLIFNMSSPRFWLASATARAPCGELAISLLFFALLFLLLTHQCTTPVQVDKALNSSWGIYRQWLINTVICLYNTSIIIVWIAMTIDRLHILRRLGIFITYLWFLLSVVILWLMRERLQTS